MTCRTLCGDVADCREHRGRGWSRGAAQGQVLVMGVQVTMSAVMRRSGMFHRSAVASRKQRPSVGDSRLVLPLLQPSMSSQLCRQPFRYLQHNISP